MPKRVIVIGSGIVGASLAWHLTLAGAEVRVLEASADFGGLATPDSWAWINASWGNCKPYFDLRVHSIEEWHRCSKTIPGLNVKWCGSLLWDLPEDRLRAFVAEHSGWGYEIKLVDAGQAARIEPNLVETPRLAAYAAGEASVEPDEATFAFLNDSHRNGAELISNARVKWLLEKNGKIEGVMTSEGRIEADEVVIAAGIGCNDLLASLNLKIEMQASPGLLVHTEPEPDLLKGLVIAPTMHIRQTRAGNLIVGTDFQDGSDVKEPKQIAAALLKDIGTILKVTNRPQLEKITFGKRPMPSDGVSCLGRIGQLAGLYVAVTHSGITLAPAIGKLCADEILLGVRHSLLMPFAPDRLALQK